MYNAANLYLFRSGRSPYLRLDDQITVEHPVIFVVRFEAWNLWHQLGHDEVTYHSALWSLELTQRTVTGFVCSSPISLSVSIRKQLALRFYIDVLLCGDLAELQ